MIKYIKKIATHPLVVIVTFSCIIISGEAMGGFYLMYILLGLPHLAIHSVAGIAGILCLLVSYYIVKAKAAMLRLIAAVCMLSSLIVFFLQPHGDYNYGTFSQFLPLFTLIIFSVVVLIFIISNIVTLIHNTNKNKGHIVL